MRTLLSLAFAFCTCAALTACPAAKSPGSADCPDNPSCLTAPECSLDASRGCLACRCSSPSGPNPGIVNSESIPPPR